MPENELSRQMDQQMNRKELLKQNMIRLVEHHREHCNGPSCDISLYLVGNVLELAGIILSEEDKRLFF